MWFVVLVFACLVVVVLMWLFVGMICTLLLLFAVFMFWCCVVGNIDVDMYVVCGCDVCNVCVLWRLCVWCVVVMCMLLLVVFVFVCVLLVDVVFVLLFVVVVFMFMLLVVVVVFILLVIVIVVLVFILWWVVMYVCVVGVYCVVIVVEYGGNIVARVARGGGDVNLVVCCCGVYVCHVVVYRCVCCVGVCVVGGFVGVYICLRPCVCVFALRVICACMWLLVVVVALWLVVISCMLVVILTCV